ncbi:MAG: hypothetical protein AB1420_18465, partial [Bacillota bacterium]
QGNPRMINRLGWEVLHQGCLDGVDVITEELFAHVCKNLGPHLTNESRCRKSTGSFFDLRFTNNLFVGKERQNDGLTDFIHSYPVSLI